MSPPLYRRVAWTAALAYRAPLEARFAVRSAAVVERAQRRRVGAVVAHADEHVPYYRETMRRLGLAPSDITVASDLAKLPLIEREQLQRDPEYFVSRAEPRGELLELRSGGSTGEPITVCWDRRSLVAIGAYRERQRSIILRLAGRRLRYREARIVSPLDAGAATSRAFSATAFLPQRLRVDRAYLSVLDPPAANLRRLNELRPEVVAAYGSCLESLFAHQRTTGEPFHRPKVVVYGADPLSEQMRALIAEQGIEVLSAYGSIEAFNIGFECERHRGLHLNHDLVPLRVVDADGRDAAVGESGEVVVSNLVNRGTVLLNYRLDDLAAKLPGECPCGRSLPLISLEGRSDEWIESASGERLHPQWMRAPLSGEPGVWRYQVVQLAPGRVSVEVVPAPDIDRHETKLRLERELEGRLGEGARVEVEYVRTLPVSARGKVRPVMSLDARRRLEAAQRV